MLSVSSSQRSRLGSQYSYLLRRVVKSSGPNCTVNSLLPAQTSPVGIGTSELEVTSGSSSRQPTATWSGKSLAKVSSPCPPALIDFHVLRQPVTSFAHGSH